MTTTEKMQYDARGRLTTQQLALSLPASWNITSPLPTDYQMALTYNDANQPVMTQTSTNPSGQGYTVTDLETRSYDPAINVSSEMTTQAQVSGSGGGTETQDYCYDEQNRLVWAGNSGSEPSPGNGTCGTAPLGNTLSGASYSNAFSYSYLDQFVQAPYNGTGTDQYLYCTSATPHQLTGVYAAGSTCASKAGKVYTASYDAWGNVISRTLGSGSSADTATLSYDLLNHFIEWNDQTSGNQSQAWYAYDSSGNRVLQRATTGGATSITVYAFGLEEHLYDGSGNLQSSTYYYSLGGRLIGELTASGTSMLLTDPLGSVLVSFSNLAGSAAVQANRVYGPTGTVPYKTGMFGTNKGFTGQYHDPATQLDYYGARYYDAKVGLFLSADSVQGNLQGMNPYTYVGANPETFNDPTGNYYSNEGGLSQQGGSIGYVMPGNDVFTTVINDGNGNVWAADGQYYHTHSSLSVNTFTREQENQYGSYNPDTDPSNTPLAKFQRVTGWTDLSQTWGDPHASVEDKAWALARFIGTNVNNVVQLAMIVGGPEGEEAAALEEGTTTAIEEGTAVAEGGGNSIVDTAESGCAGLSFTPTTSVATNHGEQAIGTMHVGEQVLAYNPTTRKMELQSVLHVWINHDNDLVDLTLTSTTHATHSTTVTRTSEVIHTNKKHPFLTKEKGFLPVGQIKLGMHVLRANGAYGVVTGWKVVPGVKAMYNLEVAQDHTFVVGTGEWVVHNCGVGTPQPHDIISYDDKAPGFEKHHGVLDAWARNNILGYDKGEAPAMVLTSAEHNATRSIFASWRYARTGSVTGTIDWTTVSAPDIQALSETMFDAAGISGEERQAYYQAFYQYIYGGI